MIQALKRLFGGDLEKRAVVDCTTGGSTAEPYPWMTEGSTSGEPITPQTVLSYSAVWQAINLISGDISKLPINVWRRRGDSRALDTRHPAWKLVARKPNRDMMAKAFWAQMLVEHCIYNKAFAYIRRNPTNLTPLELWPIPTGLVYQMDTWQFGHEVPDGLPRYLYVTHYPEAFFVMMPREVFHFRGLEVVKQTRWQHQFRQPTWYDQARDSIGLALASERFNSKFFSNGAQVGGVLAIPPNFTDQAAKNLEEGFRQRYGSPEAAFKTAVLRDGAKFIPTQIDAEKSQLHELRTDQVFEVARWFNLPPSKLGLDATVSYASKAEDNRNYLDQTLSPIMAEVVSEAWHKLLTLSEQNADSHYFEYDVSRLIATDRKTTTDVSVAELTNGVITFNEFRERINLNPVEGGDYRIVPLNMQLVDEDGELVTDTAEPEPEEGPQEPQDEPQDEEPTQEPPQDEEPQEGEEEPQEAEADEDDEDERARMLDVFVRRELSDLRAAIRRKSPDAFVDWFDKRPKYPTLRELDHEIGWALCEYSQDLIEDQVLERITQFEESEKWIES